MKFIPVAFTSLSLLSSAVYAEHCDVNFNYGVIIDPAHIRFLEQGHTKIQINDKSQLFVEGREAHLTNEQQLLLAQYSTGIRQQVPKIVEIAIEGVDIGFKTVNKVIGGLTGENSASHQRVQEKFNELQDRLHKRFNHSDKSYYIAPQDFDDFDELFAGEFEQEIEEIISTSIGSILMAVGEAMTNREEENSERRVDTFDERMESMGKELKLQISNEANVLESKAQKFCHSLIELNKIEDKMQQTIPELSSFNLIETKEH
jgi:hypothetical protein